MQHKFQMTIYACFTGYIVQAIVNNFAPLLFLTFEKTYQIPLGQITMLITINFGIQLCIDLLSAGFVDRIGYRASIFAEQGLGVSKMVGGVSSAVSDNLKAGILAAIVFPLLLLAAVKVLGREKDAKK